MAKTTKTKEIRKSKKRQLEIPRKSEDGKPSHKKLSCKSRKLDPGQSKLDHFRVLVPKLDTCSPVKVTKTGLESKMYSPIKIIDEPDAESEDIRHSVEVEKKRRSLVKKLTNSSNHTFNNGLPILSNTEKSISGHSKKVLDFTEKKTKKLKQKVNSKPKMSSKKSSKVTSSSLMQSLPSQSSDMIKTKSPLKSIKLSPQSYKKSIGKSSVEKSSLESPHQKHACPKGTEFMRTQVVTVEEDDFVEKTPRKQLKNLPNVSDTPIDKVRFFNVHEFWSCLKVYSVIILKQL